MYNGMPYGPIQGQGQGQGHVALKVRNSSVFKIRFHHFQWKLAK